MRALATDLSIPFLAAAHQAGDADDPDAVYLGMGLATRSSVATGDLPLDALAMMLVASRARDELGASRIVHLIADEHALINEFADERAVDRAAARLCTQVVGAARVLDLGGYTVVRASELDEPLHRELHLQAADSVGDPYAAKQAADVEWARRTFGASLKVGWTMEPRMDIPPRGYDERYFDGVHRATFGDTVSCLYTHAGRRLDPARPRTSPYAHEPGDARLTLNSPPDSASQMCASSSMRRHLRPLAAELLDALGLPPARDLQRGLVDVLRAFAPIDQLNIQETDRHAA